MTYAGIAEIQASATLTQRLVACAAEQKVGDGFYWQWVSDRTWDFATQPGWADAWASALVAHSAEEGYDPGNDETVITDAMILSATQAMMAAQTA